MRTGISRGYQSLLLGMLAIGGLGGDLSMRDEPEAPHRKPLPPVPERETEKIAAAEAKRQRKNAKRLQLNSGGAKG